MSNHTEHPFTLFHAWFTEACATNIENPNAMCLATSDVQGIPSARIVLLKHYDDQGFVFYTNLKSRKSKDLFCNPRAALCFYWEALEKQVRIEGTIETIDDAVADAYFSTRNRGSQIGAWASKQSQPLDTRKTLEAAITCYTEKFQHQPVPRPEFWSGFRLSPTYMEFWTQGDNRLHDRYAYTKHSKEKWVLSYLYP